MVAVITTDTIQHSDMILANHELGVSVAII